MCDLLVLLLFIIPCISIWESAYGFSLWNLFSSTRNIPIRSSPLCLIHICLSILIKPKQSRKNIIMKPSRFYGWFRRKILSHQEIIGNSKICSILMRYLNVRNSGIIRVIVIRGSNIYWRNIGGWWLQRRLLGTHVFRDKWNQKKGWIS